VFILKVVSGTGFGSVQAVLGLIVMNGAAKRSLEAIGGMAVSGKTFGFGVFGRASRRRGVVLYEMRIAKE
jgi:hypothetical protein